jgi:hypothetical protein
MSCALSFVILLEARREMSKSYAMRFEETSSTVVNSIRDSMITSPGKGGCGAKFIHKFTPKGPSRGPTTLAPVG